MDRNDFPIVPAELTTLSLSARRAWIEIAMRRDFKALGLVALRKESVDRNANNLSILYNAAVALRKESVDRNA